MGGGACREVYELVEEEHVDIDDYWLWNLDKALGYTVHGVYCFLATSFNFKAISEFT